VAERDLPARITGPAREGHVTVDHERDEMIGAARWAASERLTNRAEPAARFSRSGRHQGSRFSSWRRGGPAMTSAPPEHDKARSAKFTHRFGRSCRHVPTGTASRASAPPTARRRAQSGSRSVGPVSERRTATALTGGTAMWSPARTERKEQTIPPSAEPTVPARRPATQPARCHVPFTSSRPVRRSVDWPAVASWA
jgi:hypothetical protein